MKHFVHMATAYILRWNKPDYKEIIGVFLTKQSLYEFFNEHFPSESILSDDFKIEQGKKYDKM